MLCSILELGSFAYDHFTNTKQFIDLHVGKAGDIYLTRVTTGKNEKVDSLHVYVITFIMKKQLV